MNGLGWRRAALLLVLSGIFFLPAFPAGKAVLPLNRGWHTYLTSPHEGAPADTLRVDLPHNWDDYYGYRQQTHGNLHGTAVYETSFEVPDGAWNASRRARLVFEGVGTYATVCLNGVSLGRYPGGRVCLSVDASEALRTGTNHLQVRVEHPDMICDMPDVCGGCSSEWGFSEGSQPFGLYRPARLEIVDAVYLEPFGLHVWNSDDASRLSVEAEIRNTLLQERQLMVAGEIRDAQGAVLIRLDSLPVTAGPDSLTTVSWKLPADGLEMWSPSHPLLYSLGINLSGDGLQDADSTRFGRRTLSWPVLRQRIPVEGVQPDDGRFYLNGEPFFVNGTCEYEHRLGGGHAFSEAQIRARVAAIRACGFNAFRDAHQPHNLLYQQLWDSTGVLLWTQFSAHIWYDTPEFRENFKAQLRQWVRERRNCPSVVLWGLQNESVLPEDFARECCDLIRDLDPTAVGMRAITTCNGGVGTDWNVVQNWSGTYGGRLDDYAGELARPSQLLNGEYGAWRTLDLHRAPGPFDEKGAYTEERFAQLLETKVRLAEQARDSVCGQFQWIYNSHDNPGRRQPDEAFRLLDRVGPVNYKGLVTPWEEPVDAWYMYRANYVSPDADPMVYIVSHTWPDRFVSPENQPSEAGPSARPSGTELQNKPETGAGNAFVASLELYTNCDSVVLYNDARQGECRLGVLVNSGIKGTHLCLEKAPVRYNVLLAVAYRRGTPVARDVLLWQGLPRAPHFEDLYVEATPNGFRPLAPENDVLLPQKKQHYVCRLNCGGDDYTDRYGNLWRQDRECFSHSWAQDFPASDRLCPFQASQRVTHDPIANTYDWPLLGCFRYGRQRLSYRFDLPDGKYKVELYFVEPWYGTGGLADAAAWRRFDVALDGHTVLHNLDIWQEAGHDAALKKVVEAEVSGGQLVLDFPRADVGQALISAIAISTADKRLAREARQCIQRQAGSVSGQDWSWAAADTQRVARLPESMLPEDRNPHPAVHYAAAEARHSDHFSLAFERKKDCLLYASSVSENPAEAAVTGNSPQSAGENAWVEWSFSTGLAQIYALRFNYRNLSGRSLRLQMSVLASDGRVIKESLLNFPPNDRGWKVLSTTTGSYINAGDYRLRLEACGESPEGLQLEGLDVQ